jgi:hypothetical protein
VNNHSAEEKKMHQTFNRRLQILKYIISKKTISQTCFSINCGKPSVKIANKNNLSKINPSEVLFQKEKPSIFCCNI